MSSTSVTIFGDGSRVDQTLSEELERRGRRVHLISCGTGWPPSVGSAVIRLDTAAGITASASLDSAWPEDISAVITCRSDVDTDQVREAEDAVRDYGDSHPVVLIRHAPLSASYTDFEGHGAHGGEDDELTFHTFAEIISGELAHIGEHHLKERILTSSSTSDFD